LFVPSLIGPPNSGCRYKNLRGWIEGKIDSDAKMIQTVEESVAETLKESIMRAKNIPLKRVAELGTTVSENTTKLNKLIKAANDAADKDRVDINWKLDSQVKEL